MRSGNEIIFFGDRDSVPSNPQCVILYSVVSKEYTILSDDQNYKSIGVTPNGHCVFKCNENSFESSEMEEKEKQKEIGDEYISLDYKHFSIYKYDGKNSHSKKRFPMINKMNRSIHILYNAMCFSLFNRNGMLYHFA